jgi:hypothetical protein
MPESLPVVKARVVRELRENDAVQKNKEVETGERQTNQGDKRGSEG